jgi:hypothetical protein
MTENNSQNSQDIQKWMEDIANNKQPKKKLIFDKKTKRLIPVNPTDPRADNSLEFTTEEATRFQL